ncbi:MAG: hypothetical protein WC374_04680 [Phycisphaerae bacterium]|jgi:hypothetical protein
MSYNKSDLRCAYFQGIDRAKNQTDNTVFYIMEAIKDFEFQDMNVDDEGLEVIEGIVRREIEAGLRRAEATLK